MNIYFKKESKTLMHKILKIIIDKQDIWGEIYLDENSPESTSGWKHKEKESMTIKYIRNGQETIYYDFNNIKGYYEGTLRTNLTNEEENELTKIINKYQKK